MKIAIVGCGFVADYYMLTLANHPELELICAFDRDPVASRRFGAYFGVRMTESFAALLAEPGLELVLNLTNPGSHYAISKAALAAGHHVYSEKPLAMTIEDADDLVRLAKAGDLMLAAAPCSYLGEAAQTLGAAIADKRIGDVRLVYAEMEDGMVFREPYADWTSPSGAPWPARDEFAVGATLEHAGYYLSWLCAYFGPVVEMTAFAHRCFDDKGTGQPPDALANDLSIACLTFAGGVVARLSCGLAAPKDRSLHVIGTEGILSLSEAWDYASPIYQRDPMGHWQSRLPIFGKVLRRLERGKPGRHWFGRRLAMPKVDARVPKTSSKMDFSRGPAAIAKATAAGSPLAYGADFARHITEVALVAQNADRYAMPYRPRTTFAVGG
ncbi:Gfo/Idh/MocA family oxidoreductase [Jiella sp. MQZ9-1]|uniref:Gfo/Idh/MocA family oxidoreductase n=1 Tax=Jiella flava TaxID=2816857 RepID=A0A939FY85_9HYPH|nr:Gfo/Idh/MocA family oxidoreductase [Jiella flava]MBO0662380.1 Gfo/Idh/MocA family oxidoreductase [Jiella flava]MCD2471604.1 Gfo/Idh/MocA family oxidoreductase [Jiella flava]